MTEKQGANKSEKFWDSVSKRFGDSDKEITSPAFQQIKQSAEKYFKKTDNVLDIGCGQGDITLEIARKVKSVQGIDISAGMIEAAEQKANRQNITTAKFSKADLFNESFQNKSFDTVSTFNVLPYIHDKKDFYRRIHELLKPNGLFISSTACLRERVSLLRFLMSALTAFNFVPKTIFYKTAELETEIKEVGFTILESFNIAQLPERFIIARKD